MTDPSNPRIPGLDLAEVRAKADAERQAREAAERQRQQEAQAAAEEYVARWHRAMNKTFKGIVGGDSLTRRFFLRAQGARLDAGRETTFKGMGG